MILVANEGDDRPVVERLRQDDHDVVDVAELSPSITDEEVLELAGLANATKAEIVAEVCRDRAAELIGAFSVVSLARSEFDEGHELPGGSNFGMQPTAFGRG